MTALERIFESFLWESRLVVLLAVVASLAAAFAMLFILERAVDRSILNVRC